MLVTVLESAGEDSQTVVLDIGRISAASRRLVERGDDTLLLVLRAEPAVALARLGLRREEELRTLCELALVLGGDGVGRPYW